METIQGAAGATHIINTPLTTAATREASPDLLLNEIDRRIVKVRPSATPIDQISRMAATRRAGAMKIDYYSVDTRPVEAKTLSPVTLTPGTPVELPVGDTAIFDPTETLLCPDTEPENTGAKLVLYVVSRQPGEAPRVMPVNIPEGGSQTLKAGTRIVRMGRAAAELDVQTPMFEALPVKSSNNCQIFKTQVEESTLQRMTNKEVGWTFNDQEEIAVIDMRMGMEKSFLFGSKAVIADPAKHEDIMLTGGIWWQTENHFDYFKDQKADNDLLVDLTKKAFAGHAGSRRKILVGGSNLIDKLNRMDYTRMVGPSQTVTRWGIDFTEIRTKFGSLYVVLSETFDNCGMPDNGMVIDPQYLTKYTFIPMTAERLDLKSSGQRNTDAVVITEASCLVLRHPMTHMRVIGV